MNHKEMVPKFYPKDCKILLEKRRMKIEEGKARQAGNAYPCTLSSYHPITPNYYGPFSDLKNSEPS